MRSAEKKLVISLEKFWDETTSINKLYENTLENGKKIDRKTLTQALKGTLTRCDANVLFNLLSLAEDISGQNLKLEDIFLDKSSA